MMPNKQKKFSHVMAHIKTIGIATALAAFLADQASKWYLLAVADIAHRPPIEVTPFFNLVMVWNQGVSFGMLASHNQPYPLIALSLIICAFLVRWLWTTSITWVAAAIGLVIGGALGNIVDRLRYGAVADFFDFYIKNLHWPAFNIADSCIFIGVVLLCVDSMVVARNKG